MPTELKDYIDSVRDSSSRVRAATIVLTTVSLIVMAAVWNQQPWGWFVSKYKHFSMVSEMFEVEGQVLSDLGSVIKVKSKEGACATAGSPASKLYCQCVHSLADKAKELRVNRFPFATTMNTVEPFIHNDQGVFMTNLSKCMGHALFAFETEDRRSKRGCAKDDCSVALSRYAEARKSGFDAERATAFAQNYRVVLQDNAEMIHVGALGIRFHVNDTGILGSIALLIASVWVRLALWRHLSNLRMAFRKATDSQNLETAYNLMAAYQILTLPPVSSDIREKRPVGWIGLFLYALPLLTIGLLLYTDLSTVENGLKISEAMTWMTLSISTILAATILWICWECFCTQLEVNVEWSHREREISSREKA